MSMQLTFRDKRDITTVSVAVASVLLCVYGIAVAVCTVRLL
jgi:hypothetical protein